MTLPNSIILETYEAVRELRALTPTAQQVLWTWQGVPEVLDDIMDCMGWLQGAQNGLRFLVQDIITAEKYGEYFSYAQRESQVAPIVEKLGLLILEQLKALRLYQPDGSLPYVNCKVTHPHFHDVLLVRKEYLPWQPRTTP